jgi:fumarylacetoacetase
MSFGVFRRAGEPWRVGYRLGGRVADLGRLWGGFFAEASLDDLLAAGPVAWRVASERLAAVIPESALLPLGEVEARLPFTVRDYVDFFSSIEHASTVGQILRPGAEPLQPNWRHLPVAYHGRASTVVVSGRPVRRPSGQLGPGRFGPTERLDVELEVGLVTGAGGAPFGLVLVNDWSARDVQAWESRPLGPFLAKAFATSISAWVTPLWELEPYRVPGPEQEPPPLPHLAVPEPRGLDLRLELELNGEVVSRPSFGGMYWSHEQQLAHLAAGGAPAVCGDLLVSGTVSCGEPGCLLELTWNGERPLRLADGSERAFVADGDEVVLRGATPDGAVELGEVRARVEPANVVPWKSISTSGS